jgi:hypothetical protein
LGLIMGLGLGLMGGRAEAQIFTDAGNSFDPFALYYGYYLPRQQSIAAQMQSGSVATINANAVARQYGAAIERSQIYAPIQPFGVDELDPNAPIGAGRARGARYMAPRLVPGARGISHMQTGYYNRTAQFFPQFRSSGQGGFAGAAPMAGRPIGGIGGVPNPRPPAIQNLGNQVQNANQNALNRGIQRP